MNAFSNSLRELARQIRQCESGDIDDVLRQRCDAAAIIRAAIVERQLAIPDLAEQIVHVGWHQQASDIEDHVSAQFFSRVAMWSYRNYRSGLFPAGRTRDEVAEYATVCDLVADLVESDGTSLLLGITDELKRLVEVADYYIDFVDLDSDAVWRSVWRLRVFGPLPDESERKLQVFAISDADGRHGSASLALESAVRPIIESRWAIEMASADRPFNIQLHKPTVTRLVAGETLSVEIENEDYWDTLEALMSQSRPLEDYQLKRLFGDDSNLRKNTLRRLKIKLKEIRMSIKDWVLRDDNP